MSAMEEIEAVGDERVRGGAVGARWVRAESVYVVALVAAGFALRVWGISKMHFWDENVYLQNAETICCGKTNYSELDSRPPLLSLIFAGVFLVWNSTYAAAIVTALLNAAGAAWIYLSGRMIAGRAAGVMASLLFGFAPFFVGVLREGPGYVVNQGGHSLLADAPALSLIALAFWLLLRALERQTDARLWAAGFALAMCVLMRFGSLSSVGVLGLLTLAAGQRVRAVVACGLGFVAGMGPYLVWSRVRYGGFFTTMRNGWNNFGGAAESPLFYMRMYGDIFTWLSLAGLGIWVGWWVLRCASGAREKEVLPLHCVQGQDDNLFGSGGWMQGFLWVWGAVVLVFFSVLPHAEPRYIMPLAAPLFLLAGTGLSVVVTGLRGGARVAGMVALGCALAWTLLPLRHRFDTGFVDREESEEMQVSEFLNGSVPPGTVLYANTSYPDYAYYTDLPIETLAESGPELYRELSGLKQDGVLIAYKPGEDGWSPEPRLEWVDADPHFMRMREFPSLVVYRYRVGR
jgi:4-amino-4-deoxy-L-arabinose transferase-like glycosyltransferase